VVIDSASGLFNLHYFQHQLHQEVSRARRYSLNVCLVFFELDDYNGYIERNGRYMGDFILSDIGNIVKRNTREVDTAARYGDNLFAVLLPETRRLGAMRLAERIRKVMDEYPFPSRERKEVERLTVCVGVSSFPANADNEQDLVNKALAALTSAKTAGPNNVRLYSDSIGEETA
jgi:two-component system cell cycle response regulator